LQSEDAILAGLYSVACVGRSARQFLLERNAIDICSLPFPTSLLFMAIENRFEQTFSGILAVFVLFLVLVWPSAGWAQFSFIINADETITITG
jgi:hypothetical protein